MTNPASLRKAVELECKLASVSSELQAWKDASEADGKLEKHNTQIRAVARVLDHVIKPASERLQQARAGDIAGEALALERMVLEIHRIWGFFREKLALRYVEHFELALIAADELAWRCFEPARDQIPDGRGREPPLVYFNGASSPLTMERHKRFAAEYVEDEEISWGPAARAIELLPVPVLGIPWFQVEHLPDAPIIAHEVGHDVEMDLGLTSRIGELLERAVKDRCRRALWQQWAGEMFADVYGTLAMGPAFASTLADFLAADPREIAKETSSPGDDSAYPTTALRLLLCAQALEHAGFCTAAQDQRAALRAGVPRHAMPAAYEHDVEAIAGALIDGPYPQIEGGRLDKLISFSADWHAKAGDDAELLLKRIAPENADTRVLVAAARLAYDADPAGYVSSGAGVRVMRRIKDKRDDGVRAGPGLRDGAKPASPEDRDDEAGAALLELLSAAARRPGA